MFNYSRNIILCFILSILVFIPIHAQEAVVIISPNVFVRGIEKENGVLYTAAFIKPNDDMALRNLSVEITLPADAQFTEMLVSRQVQFDVIRRNRQGELTLIWQISRVDGDIPLDSFSFTLAEPLSSELEFYMLWQNEQGQNYLENFAELPSIVTATLKDATFTPTSEAFTFVGDTGIQIASPFNKPLNLHLLDNDFNPPAEYGAIWWCSLLQLDGLAEGESVMVIVPLRRPVAPFTELILFQQQSDESWVPLEETGIVTADGQYVIYRHTGGLVATGGEEEIRQDVVPVSEAQIEEVEQVRPEPPVNNNPEPLTNIVVETNNNPVPIPLPTVNVSTPVPVPSTADGNSNTIVIGEATADNTIRDGTSNTIIIGEASPETPAFQTATHTPLALTTSPTPTTETTARSIEVTVITATASPEPILLTQADVTVVPSSTTVVANITDTPISLTTVSEAPIVQLIGETLTPVSTIPPAVISIPSLFGTGGTRIVIFITEDGEVIQCQVASIQCAVIARTDASEE